MLFEKIRVDQLESRKAKNGLEVTLLTTLIGEASTLAKNKGQESLDDEALVALIKKFLKGVKETQDALSKTPDMITAMAVAVAEESILTRYLPQQLSTDEIKEILTTALANGAQKNMGALQRVLKEFHAGKYDGKLASEVIKSLL